MENSNSRPLTDEYQARINRVMDYIETRLDQSFVLEELAAVAGFSKFHFHRIFLGLTGETPFQFIARIRIEKSARLLMTNPGWTISEVAYSCGFTSIQLFSRTFRDFYGISPTEWRKGMKTREGREKGSNQSQPIRNISQHDSNLRKLPGKPVMYICPESQTMKWRTNMNLNKSVEVKQLPDMPVVYIRHTGPYKGDDKLFERLVGKLCTWAGPRGLLNNPAMKMIMVYHDDPNVTEEQKLRLSVCLPAPEDTKVSGDVGKMTINGGQYVVARFKLLTHQFSEAWNWVYGSWFPASGYQPDDGPCFELYEDQPVNGKVTVDICVPVKPM